MSLRHWLKRLEREAQGNKVAIPQKDGSVRRFSVAEMGEAYCQCIDMRSPGVSAEETALGAYLLEALDNAAYPQRWHQTYRDVAEIGDVPDLSE